MTSLPAARHGFSLVRTHGILTSLLLLLPLEREISMSMAYDITWTSEEEALEAASSGVDILERHYELRLLGRKQTYQSLLLVSSLTRTSWNCSSAMVNLMITLTI